MAEKLERRLPVWIEDQQRNRREQNFYKPPSLPASTEFMQADHSESSGEVNDEGDCSVTQILLLSRFFPSCISDWSPGRALITLTH